MIANCPNGIVWTSQVSPFSEIEDFSLFGISYENGMFVVVVNMGELGTSDDGVIWVLRTSSFNGADIYDIAYNEGTFIAVGDYSIISKYQLAVPTIQQNVKVKAYIRVLD